MNDAERLECARSCGECAEICLETIPLSLRLEAKHDRDIAVNLQVCAESCRAAQLTLLLDSSLHTYTCMACAAICERCAADCEELGERGFEDCIEACLDCAGHCRRMAPDTGSTRLSA